MGPKTLTGEEDEKELRRRAGGAASVKVMLYRAKKMGEKRSFVSELF